MEQNCGIPLLGDFTRYGLHAGKVCDAVSIAVRLSRADLPIAELSMEEDWEESPLKVAICFRTLFVRICYWIQRAETARNRLDRRTMIARCRNRSPIRLNPSQSNRIRPHE